MKKNKIFLLSEWLTLIVAWGAVADEYIEKDNPFSGDTGKPVFHMGICVIAWLYIMFDFFMNVCGQCHRIRSVTNSSTT